MLIRPLCLLPYWSDKHLFILFLFILFIFLTFEVPLMTCCNILAPNTILRRRVYCKEIILLILIICPNPWEQCLSIMEIENMSITSFNPGGLSLLVLRYSWDHSCCIDHCSLSPITVSIFMLHCVFMGT